MVKDWLRLPPTSKYGDFDSEQYFVKPTDASLAAVVIISAPFGMVKVSIFSFLLGLAIYQGFVFTKGLNQDAASYDSRNNFIALMVGTGVCFVFFQMTFSAKDIESMIRMYIDPGTRILHKRRGSQDNRGTPGNVGPQGFIQHHRAVRQGIHEAVSVP